MRTQIQELKESDLIEFSYHWNALCENSYVTPFQFPQWQIPWWSNFGGAHLNAVAFYYDGRLIGFAPMFIYKDDQNVRKLCLVGSGISDYLDIIVLPGFHEIVLADFFRYLIDIKETWDQCFFQDIPDDSHFLHCQIPDELTVIVKECSICPFLQFISENSHFSDVLPRKLKKNIGNYSRKLSKSCSFRLHCSSENNYQQYLNDLFRLHKERWAQKDGAGVLNSGVIRTFHQKASIELIKSNHLRIYSLRAHERPIAVYYVLVNKNRAYAYLGGFDPAMQQYSPGTLALYYVIEDSVQRGAEVFDFMRGDEPYKSLWRPYYRYNYSLTITHRK